MVTTYVQPGKTVTFTAPAGGVSSGDGVNLGAMFVIAAFDAAAAAECEGSREGVFTMTKTASEHAFAAGDTVYFDAADGLATGASAGTRAIGVAVAAATLAATSVDVLLMPNMEPAVQSGSFLVEPATLSVGSNQVGPTLPLGAVITRAWYRVLTTLTSATADTAAIGIGFTTDDANGIVASVTIAAGGNAWDAGFHETIQDGDITAATVALTAARQFDVTVVTEVPSAGEFAVHYEYVRT